MAEPAVSTIKLLSKKTIAVNVFDLQFERPAGFVFTAGQFVQFQIPVVDGTFVLRSFSVASRPDDPFLTFCVKLVPDGKASRYFDQIQVGDIATIRSAARGMFVCEPAHQPLKIFIATGSGLAPFMSMIENRLGTGDTLRLVFGVRHEEDVFWQDRLAGFRAADDRFDYQITLSRPEPSWTGLTGRVVERLPISHEPADYYLCGSLEMVKDVRAKLVENGVNTKCIHVEIY